MRISSLELVIKLAPSLSFSAILADMAEVMNGLVSEARKNRFSAIPKLGEEGDETVNNFNSKSQFHLVYCLSVMACIVLTSLALKD